MSRDVVTVPLADDGTGVPRILGMASMPSYTPEVYDEVTVRAFEWLCRTVVAVLRREHEDLENLRSLDSPAGGVGPTFADVAVDLTDRLARVRAALDEVRAAASGGDDVAGAVDDVDRLCARVQQEKFALLPHRRSTCWNPWRC